MGQNKNNSEISSNIQAFKFQTEEVIRLQLQCLSDLGLHESVRQLEKESGLQSETLIIARFKQAVLQGDWLQVLQALDQNQLKISDETRFRFLLHRQHFMELLTARDLTSALQVLRTCLSSLEGVDRKLLHQLSSLMMCSDAAELAQKAPCKVGSEGRQSLCSELQALISPSMIIPERRWQKLYEQAQSFQVHRCLYHNASAQLGSLFVDHACRRSSFPTETVHILEEHSDEVWYVAFSHSGKFLASASKDRTAIIWNVSDSQFDCKHVLSGHEDAVCFLSWSPQDDLLLPCGNDSKLRLWDTQTGECKRIFSRNQDCITSCAWLPDNRRFVSSSLDKNIYLWDSEDGKLVYRWTGARVSDLAMTSDGKLMLAACHDRQIRVYDVETKQESHVLESDSITSLSLSRDDKLILVSVSNQECHLWDLQQRKMVAKFTGHKQGKFVIRSQFGGDNYIISGSEDNNVYIWNRHHPELPPLESLSGHTGTCNSVAWNPTNELMFASASDDCTVRIWGVKQPQQQES